MENYVYNLNTYCIFFKELESSVEDELIFILYYVIKITGFALLTWEAVKLRV